MALATGIRNPLFPSFTPQLSPPHPHPKALSLSLIVALAPDTRKSLFLPELPSSPHPTLHFLSYSLWHCRQVLDNLTSFLFSLSLSHISFLFSLSLSHTISPPLTPPPSPLSNSLWHQEERVEGIARWDFFTVGYKPLRVTSVYPRPHSRVRPRHTPLIISFNRPLYRGVDVTGWVNVRLGASVGSGAGEIAGGANVSLKEAWYDEETCSLVFDAKDGAFPPAATIRVRIRPNRVCGSKGESLEPLQGDGLLKTTAFRWVFYTTHGSSEVSRYEFNNIETSGLTALLQRYRQGRLPLLAT